MFCSLEEHALYVKSDHQYVLEWNESVTINMKTCMEYTRCMNYMSFLLRWCY